MASCHDHQPEVSIYIARPGAGVQRNDGKADMPAVRLGVRRANVAHNIAQPGAGRGDPERRPWETLSNAESSPNAIIEASQRWAARCADPRASQRLWNGNSALAIGVSRNVIIRCRLAGPVDA